MRAYSYSCVTCVSRSSCSSLASQKPRASRNVSISAPSTLMSPALGRWMAHSATSVHSNWRPQPARRLRIRISHGHLVVDVELSELAQRLVVVLDQLVRGLQVELLHGNGSVYNGSADLRFSS